MELPLLPVWGCLTMLITVVVDELYISVGQLIVLLLWQLIQRFHYLLFSLVTVRARPQEVCLQVNSRLILLYPVMSSEIEFYLQVLGGNQRQEWFLIFWGEFLGLPWSTTRKGFLKSGTRVLVRGSMALGRLQTQVGWLHTHRDILYIYTYMCIYFKEI